MLHEGLWCFCRYKKVQVQPLQSLHRHYVYPHIFFGSWSKSELRLSINLSACQPAFLSTSLLFLWCFIKLRFNQQGISSTHTPTPCPSSPHTSSCAIDRRGGALTMQSGPCSGLHLSEGGIDPFSLSPTPPSFLSFSPSSKNFIECNKQRWEDLRKRRGKKTGAVSRGQARCLHCWVELGRGFRNAWNIELGIKEFHMPARL